MRVSEILALIDELKPNQYSKEIKTMWLSEIEFKAVEQVINRAEGFSVEFKKYDAEKDSETELMIPDQFADVYITYINAKIDYHNSEIERYNNATIMHSGAWEEYASWFRRNHMPKQRAYMRPF